MSGLDREREVPRDKRQEQTWKQNHHAVTKALMDGFPRPVRTADLVRDLHLGYDTVIQHLEVMQTREKTADRTESGLWVLASIAAYECSVGKIEASTTEFQRVAGIIIPGGEIVVIRAEGDDIAVRATIKSVDTPLAKSFQLFNADIPGPGRQTATIEAKIINVTDLTVEARSLGPVCELEKLQIGAFNIVGEFAGYVHAKRLGEDW